MRIELKYLIDLPLSNEIYDFCLKNGEIDKFCFNDKSYSIQSVYKYVWSNKNKQSKGKIRLRKYTTSANELFYVEEKFKKNNKTKKNRLKINKEIFERLYSCQKYEDFFSLLTDLEFKLSKNSNLKSKKIITKDLRYVRRPLHINFNGHKYRVTFDSSIKKHFIKTNRLHNVIDKELCILELKGNSKNITVLQEYLEKNYNIKPKKISKFRLAKMKYKRLLLKQ